MWQKIQLIWDCLSQTEENQYILVEPNEKKLALQPEKFSANRLCS